MPKIFKEYIYQRFVEDILIYSFAPLAIVLFIAVRMNVSLEIILAIVVNYVMYVFAFLYNDIEDREEDAKSPSKRFKNPFGYKVWSLEFGYVLLTIMAIASIFISFYVGGVVLALIAITNLVVGILYSSKKLRLKNYLIVDLLSHAYLLAGVQAIYFLALPGARVDLWATLIAIGLFLFSVGGDLENEYRDFEDDQAAGLKNTANFLGKTNTYRLSRVLWITGTVMVMIGIISIVMNLIGTISF